MLVRFCPKAYISSLSKIDPEYFRKKGIKGLILDLDNTIVPWKGEALEPQMEELLKRFRNSGLKLCVVSNAFNRRVVDVLEPLGIPWVARARKPRRKPFLKAMDILGTSPHDTAVIGDQVFTDIWGGNRLGFYTVLVEPISKKEFIGTRFVRILEKFLLYRLAKKGIIEVPGGE